MGPFSGDWDTNTEIPSGVPSFPNFEPYLSLAVSFSKLAHLFSIEPKKGHFSWARLNMEGRSYLRGIGSGISPCGDYSGRSKLKI